MAYHPVNIEPCPIEDQKRFENNAFRDGGKNYVSAVKRLADMVARRKKLGPYREEEAGQESK